MSAFINSNIFFILKDGSLVLWDYDRHKQYAIDVDYLLRLVYLASTPTEKPDSSNYIDRELIEVGILSESEFRQCDWGWDDLSKIFHFGTSYIDYDIKPENSTDWAGAYRDVCAMALKTAPPQLPHERTRVLSDKQVILSPPEGIEQTDFLTTLQARKTVREFYSRPVEKKHFESILYYSLGYIHEREIQVSRFCPEGLRARRTSPSGGGLNSITGYVYVRNVIDVDPGFYAYDPNSHRLEFIQSLEGFSLGDAVNGQFFAEQIPFGVFLSCEFDRLWWKYPHSRAYRVALLDAGHISQTLQLVATGLGLSTWISAAIDEATLAAVIGQSKTSAPLLFVGAGYSSGKDMPSELENLLMDEEGTI